MQTMMILSIFALLISNDQSLQKDTVEPSRLVACIDLGVVLESESGINPYSHNESGECEFAELSDDQILKLSESLRKINDAIEVIATRHGISMVIKRNHTNTRVQGRSKKESFRVERISILNQLSSPVVYHQKLDLTTLVLQRLKQKAEGR